MPNDKYVRLCYDMLKHYDRLGYKKWVTDLRHNLYNNGFGYVWEAQGVASSTLFVYEYIQRLKDQYVQNWRTKCSDNSKLKGNCTVALNSHPLVYDHLLVHLSAPCREANTFRQSKLGN